MNTLLFSLAALGLLGLGLSFLAFLFRRVVPTNEVHIIQSAKKTMSYGKDTPNGNTYYQWPAWIPLFGVRKTEMPTSVFDLDLTGYEAYDQGRLPFVVDIKAFFRISDSNLAAQRVASLEELLNQLKAIVQGAARTILASSEIEEILQGRSKFGQLFTNEVHEQLANWGVTTVKNIELMDLRDHKDSHVIRNIMEKKKSHIEMESRTEVAKNRKTAEMAEIEAQKEIDLQSQAAKQSVGLRTTESNREVMVAQELAKQALKDQEKVTIEKHMVAQRVQSVQTAEIAKQVKVVEAQQFQETAELCAKGQLQAKKLEAEGIMAEGQAKADAEKAMQLAPVQAQITLAQEIGSNESYQRYLVTIRQVEASQAVGIEQAKALEKANIKIISNTGAPADGLTSVGQLFTPQGGTKIGAMLEGLANTDAGKALLNTVTGGDAPAPLKKVG